MTNKTVLTGVGVLLTCASFAFAQKHPVQIGSVDNLGIKVNYKSFNKITPNGQSSIKQQQVQTLPNWSGSFVYQGTTYPYTMVGGNPVSTATTSVSTSLIALSFFFDEYVDQNGNNIVIDSAPILNSLLNSPNFQPASYTSGSGTPIQFGDAIQRAEFFNIMKKDWHTVIQAPRTLTPVQIEVPVGSSQLYQTAAGKIFALIDFNFLVSQLNTIVQLEPISASEIPMIIANDALFYDGDPKNCCTLGFHTAYESGVKENRLQIQTFVFASWIDEGIFSDPTFRDIVALSHEISETLNDPFVNNAVPAWQFPDGSGACQANLETGDPIEVLSNPGYAISLNGFTYHPQNEALLPWFTRQTPNKLSIGGAYSYPNTTLLTGPSLACAQH